jgi:hypothetical protein
MTNSKIIELYNGLLEITNLKGVKFSYAVAKNISILEKEVEVLRTTTKESDDFKQYEKERIELCKKLSKKDEKGNPTLVNGQYIMENKETFDAEFKTLGEVYKLELDNRKAQLENFEKLLKVESTVELFKINIDQIPEDVTTAQMNVLYPLIIENK